MNGPNERSTPNGPRGTGIPRGMVRRNSRPTDGQTGAPLLLLDRLRLDFGHGPREDFVLVVLRSASRATTARHHRIAACNVAGCRSVTPTWKNFFFRDLYLPSRTNGSARVQAV